jgi:hypothetical protein
VSFPQILPKIVQAVGLAGDEAELGPAVPLFGPPGRQRQARRGRHLGEDMTRGDDRGMETVFLFEDQLAHSCGVGQIPFRQNIPDDRDRLIRVAVEGLDGENHLLPVLAAVGG